MEKKRRGLLLLAAGAVLILTAAGLIWREKGRDEVPEINLRIEATDKARYAPGDTVLLRGRIRLAAGAEDGTQGGAENRVQDNTENRAQAGAENRAQADAQADAALRAEEALQDALANCSLEIGVYHLEEQVFQEETELSGTWEADGDDVTYNFETSLEMPNQDYTGYLAEVCLLDSRKRELARDTIGVDVSSDWLKFPRYGYVCEYESDVDTAEKIAQMNRYHINAIEFYDCHALHHEPLPAEATRENLTDWQDWSGRTISGTTVESYLEDAHERNMVGMAYNMIYAGTDTFVKDADGSPTEAAGWQIYFAPDNDRGEGAFTFHMGTSPTGNGNLYFMNLLNPDWQKYIFAQENHIFDVLDFDGWHGDTVGEWGDMTDAEGNPLGYDEEGRPVYTVKDTYRSFLNAAKDALGGRYLSFNPVGAQGIEQVNTSNADVLYTEFWPWDADRDGNLYEDYGSIVKEIERTFDDSAPYSRDGEGKSLVVKAYINYYKTNGHLNAPGVLLMDAAVYAAGGSRLELGNGDHMLHVEYYPDDDISMDEDLTRAMERMADFTVAYENLLRDGQTTTERKVDIEGQPVSADGESGTVWCYTREDAEHEILHLINLLGTDSEWRDERGKKAAPEPAADLTVTYYTEKPVSQVYLASPDRESLRAESLSFETGSDENGAYVRFKVPSLQYWDMIFMKE